MLQLLLCAASFEKSPTISGLFFFLVSNVLKEQQPLQVKCNSLQLAMLCCSFISLLSPHPFFHSTVTIVETKNKRMLWLPSFFSKRPKRQKINQRGEMSQAGKGSTAICQLTRQSSGIESSSISDFQLIFMAHKITKSQDTRYLNSVICKISFVYFTYLFY